MSIETGVSIKPSEAIAMGLLDNFDGSISDAKFMPFSYPNGGKTVLSLAIEFDPDGAAKFVQQYSCGEAALKNFTILAGNTKIKGNNASTTGLPDNSNAVKFLSSLVSANFPEELLGDDVSALVGTKAHFVRVSNANKDLQKEGERENKILLVEKIISLPVAGGQVATIVKAPAKGAPKQKATQAQAPAVQAAPANGQAQVASGDTITTKATNVVMGKLASSGGSATKQELAQAAFQELTNDPDRNAVIAKVANDTFLGAAGSPWSFDGATARLG